MRPPLQIMRLRSLYGDKNESFQPNHSMYGEKVRTRLVHGKVTPSCHQGWDLAANRGTPVYAIASGTCIHVQASDHANDYDRAGAYGKHVLLAFESDNHGMRRELYAFYAHLSDVYVRHGQKVTEGQLIGRTGQTGNARNLPIDQAHLHFEIRTVAATGKGTLHHLNPGSLFPTPAPETQCRI